MSYNAGILAIEAYFPSTYVDQADLEHFDLVGKGKYTAGLGQIAMSCTGDREDINSICCTVVANLLEKNNLHTNDIGRLEIGTETLIDRAKSTKTVLMNLFRATSNTNIEGITCLNGCYGGIQALFNTVAWIQSAAWDGRLGIVVAADIAVYESGPARCTGGVGAIALLIGPGASLILDPVRVSYMIHEYDFYKPNPISEYPEVDGPQTLTCYINSLEACYRDLKRTQGIKRLEDICQYVCFHAPFYRMVKKAFMKLIHVDLQDSIEKLTGIELEVANMRFEESRCQEILSGLCAERWDRMVEPSTFLGRFVGNCYCASLPASLLSLIYLQRERIYNKKILLFAYGSGLSSSLFTISVSSSSSKLSKMISNNPLEAMLSSRIRLTPTEFSRRMKKREKDFISSNFSPEDPISELQEGTFYLVKIDKRWRRYYARKHTESKL